MRFLVLFRENTRLCGEILERMAHHMVELQQRGKLAAGAAFAPGQVAAIFDVSCEQELTQLIDATPIRDRCAVETVPLSDASDFPITFGKQKGHLAAWEMVMAGRRC